MDIHKPKPIRNWREFLKEYAIIVLGVATALAAEQAVEWVHWQNEVTAARSALRAEISPIVGYYGMRLAVAPCINRKLETISVMIAEAAAGKAVEIGNMAFNGLGAATYDSEWQSQRASQTLTHFPREELALMSTLYGQRQVMSDWALEEATAWAHLAVLQDAAQKLGPDDLAQLRMANHLARRYQNAITGNAKRQLEVASRLGMRPPSATTDQIANFCNRQLSQIKV